MTSAENSLFWTSQSIMWDVEIRIIKGEQEEVRAKWNFLNQIFSRKKSSYKWTRKGSPASDGGVEGKRNKETIRILFVGLHLEGLFPDINSVPDGNGLLMFNRRRRRGRSTTGRRIPPAANPPQMVGWVLPMRPSDSAVVMIERRRERHRRRHRRRRVVLELVVRRRVWIRVLRRVRSRGCEHVTVGSHLHRLLLRRLGRRRGGAEGSLVVMVMVMVMLVRTQSPPPTAADAITATPGVPHALYDHNPAEKSGGFAGIQQRRLPTTPRWDLGNNLDGNLGDFLRGKKSEEDNLPFLGGSTT